MDHVVDTNVLLVASAAEHLDPRFADTHVPPALRQVVFEWLERFRRDAARQLVLDDYFRIYEEYRHQLSEQHYGLQVILEKMMTARIVPVVYDDDGVAAVPPAFERFDRSDRKLLAAALHDVAGISLVNATDSDWLEIEAELQAAGLRVEHLLEAWLRELKN